MFAIVDNSSISVLKALLLCDFRAHHQQMPKQHSMIICSLSETGESPAVLWDNQEVRGGHWVDVPEGKGQVVLVDDRRWDLLLYNLVK